MNDEDVTIKALRYANSACDKVARQVYDEMLKGMPQDPIAARKYMFDMMVECARRSRDVAFGGQGSCIDCGGPVKSGNICLPCVKVRYPSKPAGGLCCECGGKIEDKPKHEDYCNACFAK